MQLRTSLASALALAGVLGAPAFAQFTPGHAEPLPPPPRAATENVNYGYAQVVRVDPVYEEVRWTTPEQRCEGEPYQRIESRSGAAGTAIGALAGAVAGRQVGGGSGRNVATVAGAVAGGAIGRNVDRNQSQVSYVDGCHTVQVEHSETRIAAYDVEYRYKGEVYGSRMSYDPGQRLRVRSTVAPAEDDGVAY